MCIRDSYSIKCSQFLESKNVSAIIVACNTASSLAFHDIQKHISDIPIFNVIDPCVEMVVKSHSKKIGVLGTEKTIESNIYERLINKANKNIPTIKLLPIKLITPPHSIPC